MASTNDASVVNQGEFHARVPGSKPLDPKWVKPGNESGQAALPTFHAESHDPGSAPKESSFRPNPVHEVPGQADNAGMAQGTRTDALQMPGATSGDVHNATDALHGRPMQGMEGREAHGMHAGKRKKEHSGLEGVGATNSRETVEGKVHDLRADR